MEACCNLMPSNNSYVADFVDHLKKVKRVYAITTTLVLVLPRTFIACHASLSVFYFLFALNQEEKKQGAWEKTKKMKDHLVHK